MAVAKAKGAKGACDILWQRIVKAPQRCERCGLRGVVFHAAHIIPRHYAKVRTNEANGWCLCGACHQKVDSFPDEKMMLVERTIGRLAYEDMREVAEDIRRKMDWEDERVRLKGILKRLAA
jgi:hypothetical protein